jgi:hypothetical protein
MTLPPESKDARDAALAIYTALLADDTDLAMRLLNAADRRTCVWVAVMGARYVRQVAEDRGYPDPLILWERYALNTAVTDLPTDGGEPCLPD